MKELSHYINGEYVKGTSGRFADVYNPATGEIQAKVPLASEQEMQTAITIAQSIQPDWAAVNPQRRARVMMKFVDLLNRDMDKLAEALSKEHGKTFPDAKGDVQSASTSEYTFLSGSGPWKELVGVKCLGALIQLGEENYIWRGKCNVSDNTFDRFINYKVLE